MSCRVPGALRVLESAAANALVASKRVRLSRALGELAALESATIAI